MRSLTQKLILLHSYNTFWLDDVKTGEVLTLETYLKMSVLPNHPLSWQHKYK